MPLLQSTRYSPPVEPWSAKDKSSFAYESAVKRWPTILTGVIDTLNRNNNEEPRGNLLKEKEGTALIEAVAGLKYEISRDKELTPIEEDGEPNKDIYNEELDLLKAQGDGTWFKAPWLYAECYMYRRLRTLFAKSEHWKDFDPFFDQKQETFRSSAASVHKLAANIQELVSKQTGQDSKLKGEEVLHLEFLEMAQMTLWGNATDLSLLTNLSHSDIQALQRTGKSAQKEAEQYILANNLVESWEHLKGLKDGRVDIVLDNAGFELYTDLVFADWLVTLTPYVKEVVFQYARWSVLSPIFETWLTPFLVKLQTKIIPWFVSDVLAHDFTALFSSLSDPSFYAASDSAPEEKEALKEMGSRWKKYVEEGKFRLSVDRRLKIGGRNGDAKLAEFWTNPLPFHDIPRVDPELLQELQKSDLVIFKGDLNYRKLTGDLKWAPTTPFDEAIGPLKGQFDLLTLRTLKADVIVGLQPGTVDELDKKDPRWRVSGKYAVIQFVKRYDGSVSQSTYRLAINEELQTKQIGNVVRWRFIGSRHRGRKHTVIQATHKVERDRSAVNVL